MAPAEAVKKEIPDAMLTLRRTFPAPRESVFRAWTEPEQLKKWWGPDGYATPDADVDLRPGGRYRLAMKKLPDGDVFYLSGTYREVVRPEKLVYTWTWEGNEEAAKDSVVTVLFHDRGKATEVVLTHELLPSDEARMKHNHGWLGCLDRLAQLVQS